MRKAREKRIRKTYSGFASGTVIIDDVKYTIADKATVDGKVFLLGFDPDDKPCILYVVGLSEYSVLTPKRILKYKDEFSNWKNWMRHATIQIRKDGTIKEANTGYWWGPKGAPAPGGRIVIYVIY